MMNKLFIYFVRCKYLLKIATLMAILWKHILKAYFYIKHFCKFIQKVIKLIEKSENIVKNDNYFAIFDKFTKKILYNKS